MLVIAAETGTMIERGGIMDQPEWFIELLSWFVQIYDNQKFTMKAKSVLGDGSDDKNNRRPSYKNFNR